jgi:lipoyl synthase
MTQRFPEWIRRPWVSGEGYEFTRELMETHGLHTVCQSAHCPNMGECWKKRTATFMILGNKCTRNCAFCAVPPGAPVGVTDPEEPRQVAEAARAMKLHHVVVTSVTRDDLQDGGAGLFVSTIEALREACPAATIEVLTPDFKGETGPVDSICDARPEVFGHNIETVRRLYAKLRGRRCSYDDALGVLREAARHGGAVVVKSALMVGHGETREEVAETLRDLLDAGCEAVTIGQYLRPTHRQREVAEFITPEGFAAYEQMALETGFKHALAGPFVRSSYRSEELLQMPFARERMRARRHPVCCAETGEYLENQTDAS